MRRLVEIARKHSLHVIEDAAQAFGARCHDIAGTPFAGTVGDIGAFAFYPTKNPGAYGDAGMVTTNDAELALLVRKLRSHGSVVAYENEMLGYNSRLDELQAAILRVKLPHVKRWNELRRDLAAEYCDALRSQSSIVCPASVPGHVFYQITVRIKNARSALSARHHSQGVMANIYYPRLASELGGLDSAPGNAAVSSQAASEVLSLPIVRGGLGSAGFSNTYSALRDAADALTT